jgi:hypothetical protein
VQNVESNGRERLDRGDHPGAGGLWVAPQLSAQRRPGQIADQGDLEVRIGIATGLVVVGDLVGEGAAQEQAVVGETPNLAARLQALAEPGSVVIAPATRRLLGDRVRLQALGRHEVKGLAEPVEAWAVDGVSASEGRFEAVRSGGLTGFVGREHELGLLLERWNLARGGEGQVVLLSGEPGIGKSRILNELRGHLETQGATSLRLHCSPYYVNSAFYPIIDNFERALRFARDDPAEKKLDKLEALIVGQYGRPREDVRFIAAMLSIPGEERYGAVAMTPQKFKDETLRALVDTTEAVARRQPTVMLFEEHALGRSHHPRGHRPADPPGQKPAVADRAHPPAGVFVALVALWSRRGADPHQAHPAAEQRHDIAAL